MAKVVSENTVVDVQEKRNDSSEFVTLNVKALSLPWAIVISVMIFTAGIGSALYFGLKARPVTQQVAGSVVTPTPAAQTFAASEFAEVSLPFIEGPTLGNKEAKVVVLEFSDLVCPYCKKFHDETFASINDSYIKTGKVALVYKHFPLSFHEPAATLAAKASYCVDKYYGDDKMYAYHELFFKNTSSVTVTVADKINLVDKQFYAMFSTLKMDSNKIKDCMKTADATAQVTSDIAELNKFQADIVAKGITEGLGTPSFIVGIVKDGVLTGRLIEGAYPSIAFQNTIEEQLAK